MKLSLNFRGLARPALFVALAALLAGSAGLGGCATPHRSLSQKTRWYKRHSGGGKALPCPCGH